MLGYQKHNGLHLLRFTAHTHSHTYTHPT